ncbi:MAG: hypothetical protein QXU52_02545 [Fervidicoccaceae archaeon]
MRKRIERENLEILQDFCGDLLELIIVEQGYPIDVEEEFDFLLRYIYKNIVELWFGGADPSPAELERKLRSIRSRHEERLQVLLSYLVSRFARARSEEIARRIKWDES